MGGWFKGAGNSFVDWKGWEAMGGFFGKVGNWFQGAGNSFVGWKGFEDMSNFFSGMLQSLKIYMYTFNITCKIMISFLVPIKINI
jgi:hypothetical protein